MNLRPIAILVALLTPLAARGGDAPPTPQQAEFFEKQVRPVLVNRCFACHSDKLQSGGLRLDSLANVLKGGSSGPAVVPLNADKSRLIRAIRYNGALKMPPTGKLKQGEIDALAQWVKMGLPWPGAQVSDAVRQAAAKGEFVISDEQRKFWSFQPVRKPVPPAVKNRAWVKSPVDAFILARLEAAALKPAPPAPKRELIRRVYIDLVGLPPTPGEVDDFVKDASPNAFADVVDRLLASPRYGERWGRHWLDVARYADTKGYVFQEDAVYHNGYTYRDYVIRAFNEDLPYDRFLTEQLAADLLPQTDDHRPLAALGFLNVGRRFLNDQVLINDDRIDATCRGMMGLTVGCARCHNHKFDPIASKDYYALYGVFASTQEASPPISAKPIRDPWLAYNARVSGLDGDRDELVLEQIARLRTVVAKTPDQLNHTEQVALQQIHEGELPRDDRLKKVETAFEPAAKSRLTSLRARIEDLKAHAPQTPDLAMAVQEAAPFEPYVFLRGNPGNRGDPVKRRFITILGGGDEHPFTQGSGRLDLARAIASKDNPLTARVLVNRVWMYHFGAALVRTPSDFGTRGERPTHPELLDWLASSFMENGWSIKKLHRTILLSNAYRMSADSPHPQPLSPTGRGEPDPENRLIAHMNRQRMDLEALRDSLLDVSGRLDTTKVGGPAVELTTAPFTGRRTVYGFIDRQNLQGLFRTFDFATPDASSARRYNTTIPQQALFMMNSPFVIEQAKALAANVAKESPADEARRIRLLYRDLYGRLPDADETELGLRYVRLPSVASLASPADWQFGYGAVDDKTGRVTTFTPLPFWTGSAWQGGPKLPDPNLNWAMVTATGGHAGHDLEHCTIRRWTAPEDLTLSISGRLEHDNEQGDGVRARIVSSREGLLGEWPVHDNEADTNIRHTVVKRGDAIDFVIDCRSNDGFDSFSWAPVIRAIPENGVIPAVQTERPTWNAETQFHGPSVQSGLTQWERYVQALLMTNEFAFVD